MCSWDSWTCFDAATFFGIPYMSMAQHVHPMSHGILCISSPGTRWRENMRHLRPGLIVSAVIVIILQKFNTDTNMAIFGAYMLNFSGIWFRISCVTRVRYKGDRFFSHLKCTPSCFLMPKSCNYREGFGTTGHSKGGITDGDSKQRMQTNIFWLVVSNIFIFIPTWGNDPIWLIFSSGLKPPTRYFYKSNSVESTSPEHGSLNYLFCGGKYMEAKNAFGFPLNGALFGLVFLWGSTWCVFLYSIGLDIGNLNKTKRDTVN